MLSVQLHQHVWHTQVCQELILVEQVHSCLKTDTDKSYTIDKYKHRWYLANINVARYCSWEYRLTVSRRTIINNTQFKVRGMGKERKSWTYRDTRHTIRFTQICQYTIQERSGDLRTSCAIVDEFSIFLALPASHARRLHSVGRWSRMLTFVAGCVMRYVHHRQLPNADIWQTLQVDKCSRLESAPTPAASNCCHSCRSLFILGVPVLAQAVN